MAKFTAGDDNLQFELNGKPWARGHYELIWDQDNPDYFGISGKTPGAKNLIEPKIFSEWITAGDIAYANQAALMLAFKTFFF